MKTRVWKATLIIHDCPGYDDEDGTAIPFITKKELVHEIQSIGPQCYGLTVQNIELTNVGHIPAPPTTRRPRKEHSLELVPRKQRVETKPRKKYKPRGYSRAMEVGA